MYNSICVDDVKKLVEWQICCGEMTENNHLMCPFCSKTWCADWFKKSLSRDNRCPNCRAYLDEKKLIKNSVLMDIFEHTRKTYTTKNILKSFWNSHNKFALIKWLDWDEKLWDDCVWSEIHWGHNIKSLESLYKEIQIEAIEEKEKLKAYSKKMEDSEYSLGVVKILKDDKTNNAIYSIISKLTSFLQSQGQRMSSSFSFIDNKIAEGEAENSIIQSLLQKIERALDTEINFEIIDEMKKINKNISEIIKTQKRLEISKILDEHRFKSIDIEKPPLEFEFQIPIDEILEPKMRVYNGISGINFSLSYEYQRFTIII